MLARIRRLSVPDRLAAGYALAYVAWLVLRTPRTPASVTVGTLAFLPLGFSVAWACWANSRVAWLDRRTRAAWQLLSLSFLCLWVSGSAWSFYLLHNPASESLPLAEYLEFSQHLFAISAYLLFPGRWPPRRSRLRFLLDLSLTAVASFLLAFHFGLEVQLGETPQLVWNFDLTRWVIDWIVVIVLAVGFLQKAARTTRRAMGLLLAANTLYLVANYGLVGNDAYQTGDTVDILWFLAWIVRWGAVRYAWYRYSERGAEAAGEEDDSGFVRSTFSYLVVAGAFLLLVSRVLWGDEKFLGLLAAAVTCMTVLLVVRQMLEIHANRQLFTSQLEQEARFRLLVQHSSDAVLIAKASGSIAYVSPSADRVFGTGVARAGTALSDLLVEEDRPVADALLLGCQEPGVPVRVRLAVAGGAPREVEIAWTDLRQDAAFEGFVLNCRDVTERNELERQLRHAQKLDAVGQMAGGLAHDFNNVLTAIRGYSELLQMDLDDPALARDDLGHIAAAVDRAAAVTRKLLALSRNQPVRRTVVDVNAILRELLPLLRQLLTDRIEVVLELDPGAWPVTADQGQVEQVLLNLATNARDAMPNGGRLRIATRRAGDAGAAGPEGETRPAGDYTMVEVSDEGLGMSPEVQSRIFEPFYTTKSRDRGMGLGLAVVMGIVNDSGGRIEVESTPGRGTIFRILLPRSAAALKDAPARTDAAVIASSLAGRTVLLVDDERSVRAIARRMLEQQGCRVVEAGDGVSALKAAGDASLTVDLLLTDLVMPGLHGSELISRFRAVRPAVPIICMTGFAGGDSEEKLGVEGAVAAIIAKPFSADELRRVTSTVLRSPSPTDD
jgi:two-component system, cell cycle sensor histidine kinase and response regulator CckA